MTEALASNRAKEGDVSEKILTHQVDLPPDIDGIIEAIKGILKQGSVQSIHLVKDEPIVYTRVYGPNDSHPFDGARSYEDLPIEDIIRHRPMEEMPVIGSRLDGPYQLIQAMVYMSFRDYVVTHIVIGNGTHFWKWLGIDMLVVPKISHVCGAKIEVDKTLDSDRVILCGARTRTALKNELEYSLVIYMEKDDGKKGSDKQGD